jgi:hypothetical protein
MDAPDFVVRTGVATSAVAGAAHDALLEDGLDYHGVGRGAEGTDRLREAMIGVIGEREERKGRNRCTLALSTAVMARRGVPLSITHVAAPVQHPCSSLYACIG